MKTGGFLLWMQRPAVIRSRLSDGQLLVKAAEAQVLEQLLKRTTANNMGTFGDPKGPTSRW